MLSLLSVFTIRGFGTVIELLEEQTQQYPYVKMARWIRHEKADSVGLLYSLYADTDLPATSTMSPGTSWLAGRVMTRPSLITVASSACRRGVGKWGSEEMRYYMCAMDMESIEE